jgi:hypothetical protein
MRSLFSVFAQYPRYSLHLALQVEAAVFSAISSRFVPSLRQQAPTDREAIIRAELRYRTLVPVLEALASRLAAIWLVDGPDRMVRDSLIANGPVRHSYRIRHPAHKDLAYNA